MDLQRSVFLDIATHTTREWDRCVGEGLSRYAELMESIWYIIAEGLKVITGKSYTMARDEHGYGILNKSDHSDVLWSEMRTGAATQRDDKDPDNI